MKAQFLPYSDENPTESTSFVTYGLIVANIVVFVWSLFDMENVLYTWGFIPAAFAPITIVTSMFLHGGIEHIVFNMWFLFLFGDNIEDKFGHAHYLGFYILAGLFAAIIHFLTNPASAIPTIGASGAVSGILGAYIALFPRVRVKAIGFYMSMNVSALWIIGSWFVLQLFSGFVSLISGVSGGIAFWAHIGGFVFGYGYTRILKVGTS
ncbi:MAG: rhomboid family intramembrane serine protease [Candidatus Aenigmatarchaeota archaeon]